jgi:hypothetical protein
VAEELLDVVFVHVGLGGADDTLEAPRLCEGLHRGARGVPVLEARGAQRAGVDAAPVPQQGERLGWEVDRPQQPERHGRSDTGGIGARDAGDPQLAQVWPGPAV